MRRDRPPCTFHLSRHPDKKGFDLLMIRTSKGVDKFHCSTGVKIPPKAWDHTKQKAKNVDHLYYSYRRVNDKLDRIRVAYNNFFDEVEYQGREPSTFKAYMKLAISGVHPAQRSKSRSFVDYLRQRIEDRKQTQSYDTVKVYRSVLSNLEFYEQQKGKSLVFEDINIRFSDDYERLFTDVELMESKEREPLSIPYIKKQLTRIRTIMQEAEKEGLHSDKRYLDKAFLRLRGRHFDNPKQVVFPRELEALKRLELSDKPHLEKTRDFFLIGCYSGLRFSDLTKLNLGEVLKVVEDDSRLVKYKLKMPNKKSSVLVDIPAQLGSPLLSILRKYKDGFPKAPANQVFNRQIKQVCKLAGMTQEVREYYYGRLDEKGNQELLYNDFPKYEKIASHTARRSFVTNKIVLDPNSNMIEVMRITGHRTPAQLLEYLCVDPRLSWEDVSKELIERSNEVAA